MKRWVTIAYFVIAALAFLGFIYLGIKHEFTAGQNGGFVIVAVWIFVVIAMKMGLVTVPPLHDMSREFWHLLGLVFLVSAIVLPITGWYLKFGGFFVFSSFLGCFMGAAYMLQLGNASDSRKDRSE